MEIQDFVELFVGINKVRLKGTVSEENFYSVNSIDDDLNQLATPCNTNVADELSQCKVKKGDVIFSAFKKKAAVVSIASENKILTSNFCLCKFDHDILDPWYFCYFVNETLDAKNQLLKEGIKILSTKNIKLLNIDLPPIELQRKIGEIYKMTCRQNCLNTQKQNLTNEIILNILRNYIK